MTTIKIIIGIVLLIIAGLDIYTSCYSEGYGDGIVDAMNTVNDVLTENGIYQKDEMMSKATEKINKKIEKNWRIK